MNKKRRRDLKNHYKNRDVTTFYPAWMKKAILTKESRRINIDKQKRLILRNTSYTLLGLKGKTYDELKVIVRLINLNQNSSYGVGFGGHTQSN